MTRDEIIEAFHALSDPQKRMLNRIPEEWGTIPIFGDLRPLRPLKRSGLIETREVDTTPPEHKHGPVKFVDAQWRLIPDIAKHFRDDAK